MQKSRELGRKPFEAEVHINKNSSINSGLISKKIVFLVEKQISTEIDHSVSQEQTDRFNKDCGNHARLLCVKVGFT
jgi:hypothetical protein